jgi:hypothetical protein
VTERARAFACALLLLGPDRAAAAASGQAEGSLSQAATTGTAEPAESPAPEAGPPARDSDEDLRERLAARDRELGALRSEIERLKAKNATLASVPAPSPAPVAAPVPGPSATPLPIAGLDPPTNDAGARAAAPGQSASGYRVAPLLPLSSSEPGFPAWQRELAAAVGACVLGFGLGWRTLDRRIRRKYGGLKIY